MEKFIKHRQVSTEALYPLEWIHLDLIPEFSVVRLLAVSSAEELQLQKHQKNDIVSIICFIFWSLI